jgi:hypothetical protein
MSNLATAPRRTQTLRQFTYGDDITGTVSDYGKSHITIEAKPGQHYTAKLNHAEKGLLEINRVYLSDVIRLRSEREGIEYVLKLDIIERGKENFLFYDLNGKAREWT